ncbi:nucleoside-diphosphate kinase [Kutzneria sp. CA-103260]|uniref:nucleoside-diphosphate kinase n=1 Tax=Kutzneria sp. CA-103260 TaxID=2802641 RepID=UPI001BAA64D2|nr:nucleoside-diphosphate kinase [Kutzneria sp. CA-103260]
MYPELATFHQTVVGRLPDTCLELLPRTALVVVPPDGLMQGVHRRLLDEHGEHVVAFRFRVLSQRLAERLYLDGLVTRAPGRHIRSWWIKSKLFDLGEALVLLMRHPTDPGFQATVTALKGASDPMLAKPGTYREHYRTPNKTFGLLHSSDDLLSMLYEANVLFEPEGLTQLLTKPCWDPAHRALVSGYEGGVSVRRIESYRVLYRLKRRLLAEPTAAGVLPVSLLEAVEENYRTALDVVAADPGHIAETVTVARLLVEERGLLDGIHPHAGVLAAPQEEDLRVAGAEEQRVRVKTALACLRTLTEPTALRTAGFESLESSLEALGIPLTALERTVLESLFFFYATDPPRATVTTSAGAARRSAAMPNAYQQVLDAAEKLEDYPLSPSDVAELGRTGLEATAGRLAFMIVTPDAVHRGLHADTLTKVHNAGFRVLAHQTRNLRDSDIEELYKDGLRAKILENRRTHWYLTRKGLGFGTSLGLLLHHPDGDACERLLRLKGASKPAEATPDSVRGSLGSYSKILALMHSSDTPPAVLRECLLYFTAEQVRGALSQLAEHPTPQGTPISLLVEALSPTTSYDDPFTVLYALKIRISHALAAHPLTGAELQPMLEQHLSGLRAMRATLSADRVPWPSRTAAVGHELEREHKLLVEGALAQSPQSAPGESLERLAWHRLALTARQLADQQGFGQLDMDQVRAALHAAHVHLTSWEALLVENLVFFWEP